MTDCTFRKEVNFRDLGGYPSADGRTVRIGCFYRSGGLFLFNEKELEAFRNLQVRTVIDLRTASECAEDPDPDLGETIVRQQSGLTSTKGEEIDFSPTGMMRIGSEGLQQLEDLTGYYRDMPFHNPSFMLIFEHIRKGNTPLVFHCASGKDRTGVATMMVLGLLGCSRETILEDYLLSNLHTRSFLDRAFANEKEDLNLHPERRELLQMMFGVSPRIGNAVLDEIDRRYSSMEDFLKAEYDFTAEEIEEIRNRYLI